MSQRNNEPTDPFSVWNAVYGQNMEIWSRGMAELINTEAVSQALRTYLDHYLATSEPFRKIPEQYLEFWLTSMNMPSREELGRLAEQVAHVTARLDELGARADQTQTAAPDAATQADIEQMRMLIQSLDAKLTEVASAVYEQAPNLTALSESQQSRSTELEGRIGSLEGQIEQVAQLVREHSARMSDTSVEQQPAQDAELEGRIGGLEGQIEQVAQLVREHVDQMAALPVSHAAHGAALHGQVQGLDEKAGQLLQLIKKM
jgi:chromosome segregation ATPase